MALFGCVLYISVFVQEHWCIVEAVRADGKIGRMFDCLPGCLGNESGCVAEYYHAAALTAESVADAVPGCPPVPSISFCIFFVD